jgi:flavin reductase (DIM6/NTAB) family NADH-FMN oxidoreductase RutF
MDSKQMPDLSPSFTTTELRNAFGQFATGVAIVTAWDAGQEGEPGRPVGLTINSFASVSLEPPLLLWSLDLRSGNLAAYSQAGHHLIHVLGAKQRALAERFATRGIDRFAEIDWEPGPGGVPRLSGCAATFDCIPHQQIDLGDHRLFVLEVVACSQSPEPVAPLVFQGGRMHSGV